MSELRRDYTKKSPKKKSQRQEKRIAREVGARLTPNSGALSSAKSDAVDAEFRYEMKTTDSGKIPIGVRGIKKIWKEAVASGRSPAVVMTIPAMAPAPADWVIIEFETFKALLRRGV